MTYYVAPIVAVIDPSGNLYCVPCAETNQVSIDTQWASDNSALQDAGPCRGCGTRVPYNPAAYVAVDPAATVTQTEPAPATPNTDVLNTVIDTQLRAADRADVRLAALHGAAGVAALREQFPTAAYAWIENYFTDAGRHAVEVCRVLDGDGTVLWDADPVTDDDLIWDREDPQTGPVDLDDVVTEAFRAAAERQDGWYQFGWDGDAPAAAGEMPATASGVDPSLVVFAAVDKRAAAEVAAAQTGPAGGISFGDGAHDAMVRMLQEAADGGWTVEPLRAGEEPGGGTTIRLTAVNTYGLGGQVLTPDGEPTGRTATFDWVTFPHVHIH